MTPKIVVRDLVKTFPTPDGRARVILDHVSFSLAEGTFVSAVGPSGCGKSTLLNIVAGLVPATSGTVELSGKPVVVGQRRDTHVGYVFQQPRLLNWLTVEQNIEFALQASEIPRAGWGDRVSEAVRLVRLEAYRAAFPLRLSGGQHQRVSIARALAIDPEVVLMDEPFSHLDEISAARLREELMEIWERTGKTALKGFSAEDDRYVGMDLERPRIDFVGLARSLGVPGERVETAAEVPAALRRGMASGSPYLVDVSVDGSFT